MAADGHAGDAAPAVALEAVLLRFALGVDRGVIGAVDKRLRGADVGVLEPVGHQHQRRGVVIAVVVRVHHDVHAELLGEVEHLLLHIADDERDVADPGLLQLADLPLDEQLTLDAQQCLRLFIRERGEARAHARRHNHGVFYAVGRKRLLARVRDTSAREQPRLRQRRHGLVDLAERHVRLRGQRALRERLLRTEIDGFQNFKLCLGQHGTTSLFISCSQDAQFHKIFEHRYLITSIRPCQLFFPRRDF